MIMTNDVYVFDVYLFLRDNALCNARGFFDSFIGDLKNKDPFLSAWYWHCDGLTVSECLELGYVISPLWTCPEKDYYKRRSPD